MAGNVHAGILRGILAVLGPHDSGIVTKRGLELVISLFAQLVFIAKEEGGLGKLSRLAQAPKQIGSDNRLPSSRSKRKQNAGCFAVLMALDDFFEGCSDGRILIVARLGPCGAVLLEEDCRLWLGNVNACVFGIAGGQVTVGGEVRERPCATLQLGGEIVLAVKMSIGRKDVFDIEAFAVGIAFGLLHSLEWIFRFLLRFKDGNGQRLGHLARLNTEKVIRPSRPLCAAVPWSRWVRQGLAFRVLSFVDRHIPLTSKRGR